MPENNSRDVLAAALERFDVPDLDGFPAFSDVATNALAALAREGWVLERKELREAAQAVLDELDIIRDHRRRSGVGYLAVHPDTHEALRAAIR